MADLAQPAGSFRAYRSLLWLYPRSFRREYGGDLVAHFADLAADRGRRAAWARTGADLVITVPRYRLESIMNERQSTTSLNITLALLAAFGVLSVLAGFYPGALLLVVAAGLAVAQRSALARSIRTPDSSRRRRRLWTASALALVSVVSVISYLHDLGDDRITTLSLVVHNAVGVPAMLGALIYLVVGLLTPSGFRADRESPATG